MLRKAAAAGLAGLGLIGGAGTVVYHDNGDATVKIKDQRTGKVQSVTIHGGGATFSCPGGTRDRLEPYDIKLGRIKLTLQHVRRAERAIELQYPTHTAPSAVVDRYRALLRRDNRLVSAYNGDVDARNAILNRVCTSD